MGRGSAICQKHRSEECQARVRSPVFSKIGWRDAAFAAEDKAEVIAVLESAGDGDLGDGHLKLVFEAGLGFGDALFRQHLAEGAACACLQKVAQIIRRDMAGRRRVLKPQVVHVSCRNQIADDVAVVLGAMLLSWCGHPLHVHHDFAADEARKEAGVVFHFGNGLWRGWRQRRSRVFMTFGNGLRSAREAVIAEIDDGQQLPVMHDGLKNLPHSIRAAAADASAEGRKLHATVFVFGAGSVAVQTLDETAERMGVDALVIGYPQCLACLKQTVDRLNAQAAFGLVFNLYQQFVYGHGSECWGGNKGFPVIAEAALLRSSIFTYFVACFLL